MTWLFGVGTFNDNVSPQVGDGSPILVTDCVGYTGGSIKPDFLDIIAAFEANQA